MAKVSIAVHGALDEEKDRIWGEDEIQLVYRQKYQKGDKLIFIADQVPDFYIIRTDGAMDEAYVYLTQKRLEYPNAGQEQRKTGITETWLKM